VAIDGETLRRSYDETIGKDAIHMVSAWASKNSLVLGQVKVNDKSNEIMAIPQLLDVLDIAFREDESRSRKGNGAQNFAVLRHIALNLSKQERTYKRGIKNKRLKAAWSLDYLVKVLAG
jgi:hypothetical protein